MNMHLPIGLRPPTPPSPPRRLRVVRVLDLSPRMRRITLGGELDGFPSGSGGAHVKLFFRREGQRELTLPRLGRHGVIWPPQLLKPVTRTYSVSHFDPVRRELSIDFVLHGETGPASRFAARARIGDEVGVAGPGGPNPLLAPAGFYVMTGDLSALPAIAALLELMPAATLGRVFLEVPSPEELRTLRAPAGVSVRWLFREPRTESALPREIRALSLDPSHTFAWLAGEGSAVVAVRDHLLNERGFLKTQLYATPYWRETLCEEEYHEERHRIMDELVEQQAAAP
jgi:NADPH-dependent ferric siderophore reductase